eukprot:m.80521 g.80521  ORF g.80521 m.80521 type:complete len:89 (-) comp14544_c0_seq1:2018-2284(-)
MALRQLLTQTLAKPAHFAVVTRCASSKAASKTAANKYDTSKPDSKGFFGRSVHYTDVHTSQLETFYDLTVDMQSKRCPQPVPEKKKEL